VKEKSDGKQQRVILCSWIVELKLNSLDVTGEKINISKFDKGQADGKL